MRLKGSIIAARAYKRKGGGLPLLQGEWGGGGGHGEYRLCQDKK